MPVPALPNEVWAQIIPHLRQPLPRPTGRNERSSIRQDALAKAMRVNRVFNTLAAPLLYTTIVTDNLYDVVQSLEEPAAIEGIKSKAELLSHLKHLYLEYADKGHGSYEKILRGGKAEFDKVGPSFDQLVSTCANEADHVGFGIGPLEEAAESGDCVIQLETFSTGAFLDGQGWLWQMIANHAPEEADMRIEITNGQNTLADFLYHFNPKFFCQRITYGPLAFAEFMWDTESSTSKMHHRAHLRNDAPPRDGTPQGAVPLIYRGESRWYLEVDPAEVTEEDEEKDEAKRVEAERQKGYDLLLQTWAGHNVDREIVLLDVMVNISNKPLTIQAYVPKVLTDPEVKPKITTILQRQVKEKLAQRRMAGHRCEKDKFSFESIEDSPPCEACSWSVGDLRR